MENQMIVTKQDQIEFLESMRESGLYLQCWKLDDGEEHSVAARTADEALREVAKLADMTLSQYLRHNEVKLCVLGYGHLLTVRNSDTDVRETKTVAEWLADIRKAVIIATTAW